MRKTSDLLVASVLGALSGLAVAGAQGVPPAGGDTTQAAPAAQSSPMPARLSDVEGTVRIAQTPVEATAPSSTGMPPPPPPEALFRQALPNMPVMAGMDVQTGSDGRAELQFPDGDIARVAPNSEVVVVALGLEGERLRAANGLSYYEQPGGATGSVAVLVGPDVVTPQGSSLLRVDLDKTPYQVAVLRGAALVDGIAEGGNSPGVGFALASGQTAMLAPASPQDYDVKSEASSNSWDTWNTDRDAASTEMANGSTAGHAGSDTEEAEAWNDLDYYGTWYDVPGAGLAWGPDGVDASFDPYGAGAWGFYPGVGYTWISSYPWGWLPYRCGGWGFFPSFGWLWQPGNACGLRWFPYPAIRSGPPGYRIPSLPSQRRLSGAHIPRPEPLLAVHRGTAFQFRQLGGARPAPRQLTLPSAEAGGTMIVAPMLSPGRQDYRASSFGPMPRTGPGGLTNEHMVGPRAIYVPPPRVNTPAPRAVPPAPVRSFTPPPAPAMPHIAPAPGVRHLP